MAERATPPPAEAPPARRRLSPDVRREELLAKGEEVVRTLGRASRVEDVVAAVGVARGTFYLYFPTWEDFVQTLRERALARLAEDFRAARDAHLGWRSFMEALPGIVIDLTLRLEGLHEAVVHVEAQSPSGRVRGGRIEAILLQGHDAGAFVLEQPHASASLLSGLIYQATELVLAGADRDETATACGELLVRALRVQDVPFRAEEIAADA